MIINKLSLFSTYQLSAYLQFTLWARGKVGCQVWHVIPACVVHRIRLTFPSGGQMFKGFEGGCARHNFSWGICGAQSIAGEIKIIGHRLVVQPLLQPVLVIQGRRW